MEDSRTRRRTLGNENRKRDGGRERITGVVTMGKEKTTRSYSRRERRRLVEKEEKKKKEKKKEV